MSTPFDDDALQEGLGHGLFGVSRSPTAPGLGQSLLSGFDAPDPSKITLYQYPGDVRNPFGHIGMSVNGGHVYGKAPVPGMEMQSLRETVQGIVEPVNHNRRPSNQITLPADAGQRAYLLQYLQDRSQPTTYQAETDNCANYLYNALKGAGFKVPALNEIETPEKLMQGLHQIYDTPAQPTQ